MLLLLFPLVLLVLLVLRVLLLPLVLLVLLVLAGCCCCCWWFCCCSCRRCNAALAAPAAIRWLLLAMRLLQLQPPLSLPPDPSLLATGFSPVDPAPPLTRVRILHLLS